jgi:hypothetical protein
MGENIRKEASTVKEKGRKMKQKKIHKTKPNENGSVCIT